jgi:hypothetical protein
MALESSPTLKDYGKGLTPKDRSAARRRISLIIVGILFLLTAIVAVNFLRSDELARAMGAGTIVGVVVDENGKPLDAEIYVLRTDIQGYADSTGAFQVRGVPAGARAIVIARQGGGMEFPVMVTVGSTTDMGKLKFVGTRVPGQ